MAKLANLMNQLNKCRENKKDLDITFVNTTQELQKRLKILRTMVKEKDKEIKELKTQVEVMMDG